MSEQDGTPLQNERMMKWFSDAHLPEQLQAVSALFHELAVQLLNAVQPGPERTVALRKLIESKDSAVRAKLYPTG